MPKKVIIKYDYYDDEAVRTIRAFINAVKEHHSALEIEHRSPLPFEKFIFRLKQGGFDGLILDLRLDQMVNSEGERANFRATSFAQELRNLATEGQLADFPIVLWSMDDRLRHTYLPDNTGHDLFDLKCIKEDIAEDENFARETAEKLVSLSTGYKRLSSVLGERGGSTQSRLISVLGLDNLPEFLDPRITTYFEGVKGRIPPHEYARLILKGLLDAPGPLIDELVLAARLGVSLENSNPDDWNAVKQKLKPFSYSGVFGDGWARWWTYLIEDWWRKLAKSPGSLRSTGAEERVEYLKKLTKRKGLIAAKPISKGYSTNFWTVCQATKRPLSPKDGFTLKNTKEKPWQDRLYISIDLALSGSLRNSTLKLPASIVKDKRIQREGLAVDPLELERLKNARKNSQSE